MTQERWQLSGHGPENYERYQVPSIFEPLARMFLAHLPLQPGQRILDVACGTGIVARLAAAAVGKDARIVGVDLNAGMLEIARTQASGSGAAIEWREGDAVSLPCADDAFDMVLCQQGLQFFTDKAAALNEMRRVLVAGGLAGLCVWRSIEHSPCHVAISQALARHAGAAVAQQFQAPFGFGEAGPLRAVLADAGFREVEVRVAVVMRRLRSPAESVPGLLASTPVGPAVAALDEKLRQAIVDEVATALAGYRDNDGMTVPQATHIALARK